MNFSESNRLVEEAAKNNELNEALEQLRLQFESNAHDYMIAIAKDYNVEIKPEYFYKDKCTEAESRRILIIGLILSKNPELLDDFYDFVHKNDHEYAVKKCELAKRFGIDIDMQVMEKLCMWTGLV